MSAIIILIFAWLSSYIFDGGPMGQPIDVNKCLNHFWSNTPLYIALVSAFELIIDVSDYLLAHQLIMVPLKRWTVEIIESLSEMSLAWSAL